MNKLKIGIPVVTFAISSLAISSIINEKSKNSSQTTVKTAYITQPNDTFKSSDKEKTDMDWWEKALKIFGGATIVSFCVKKMCDDMEKLQSDPDAT